MSPYVGSAISRVDGRAKVTGAAKYAAEFSAPDLAYGSVIGSTIPRGRIVRIDTSEALRVAGVLDVLTHEHRPPMPDKDDAYKDDVAPDVGSPFRPLFDDKIMFSAQPVALVLAEDWDTAQFAASLVRIEYQAGEFATDIEAVRGEAFVVEKPDKPRGNAARAFAAAKVKHEAEYFVPIEHHNPMELFACDGGVGRRRQAHRLRQDPGRAECAEISVRHLRQEARRIARDERPIWAAASARACVRNTSAMLATACGARAEALGAPRPHAPADVRPRLPADFDRAGRDRRKRRRHARGHHPRGDRDHLALRALLAQ